MKPWARLAPEFGRGCLRRAKECSRTRDGSVDALDLCEIALVDGLRPLALEFGDAVGERVRRRLRASPGLRI